VPFHAPTNETFGVAAGLLAARFLGALSVSETAGLFGFGVGSSMIGAGRRCA
jgi:hypothetical protein